MLLPRSVLQPMRGLRFRLAFAYMLFFTTFLLVIGGFFRWTLQGIIRTEVDDALEEEWGAVKGYLQVVNYGPDWFYDPYDPEETFIVSRLQRCFLLTDANGKPVMHSPIYDAMGIDSPAEIKAILSANKPVLRTRYYGHEAYRVRSGKWVDKNQVFYLAVGKSMAEDEHILGRFTRDYFLMLPAVLILGGVFGWYGAGRALEPLDSVSRAAQRITGANLKTRIEPRGAGDELDHLVLSFNAMMDRLDRSFEQIRQFSTDVSHELRTPLTVIRGQLEVALFTAETPAQYRAAMEDALVEVERLSSIVRALLLLSQSETGQLVLQKTGVDLAEVARDIVDQFQIPAEGHGVSLSVDAPASCVISADRIQIERLLSNLLSNAVKYTPADGRVHVALSASGGEARLVVEDTGVGIPAEHLPRIFERFYRVSPAGPEKGLGLGLSFVAWIVKAHGGTIQVESEVGRGTRFTVTLPVGDTGVRPVSDAALPGVTR